MKLESILQLDPITATIPRVHAGHDRLAVPVTWVHISEMERVAQIFQGGELLLTQGRGIPRTAEGQVSWIDALADAGVAGVAIETGHVFADVPSAAVEAARARGLPLIELPRPAYFMEITRAVHSTIVQSEHDALVHSVGFARRLGRLILGGGAIQEVLDEVTSAAGGPVALTGPTHSLRAGAPLQHPVFQGIPDWRRHTLAGHDLRYTSSVAQCTSESNACSYVSIHVGGEFWGCLHALTDQAHMGESLTLSLELAATFLAMAYGPRENLRSLATDMPSAILRDVLTTSTQNNRHRLRWGGLDPDEPLRVLVFEPVEIGTDGGRVVHGHRRIEELLALSHRVQAAIPDGAIVGNFSDRIAAIVPQSCDLIPLRTLTWSIGRAAIVGASGLSDSDALARAARDANEALDYAVETRRTNGVFYAEHLYLERLLLRLNEDGTLRATVEHELGPILNLNAGARTALLQTLEAYFTAGGVKSDIARALAVDRRTVHHRLERINRLVGKNFDHPDKQLSLRLALRGYRLLEDRQRA